MARSETAQQREFNKYHHSWLRSTEASATGNTAISTSCRRDPALIALAQLATHRLNIKTGTISLVHGDNRILLAEAGQDSPLSLFVEEPKGYSVWKDCSTQRRELSLDEHVFGSTWSPPDVTEKQGLPYAAFVADDVAKDPRLADHASLFSEHHIGFFAGVPIFAGENNAIGVLAVSDPCPRPQSLSVADINLLQDLAHIASDHLERVRCAIDRIQSEGFMRGLTTFVEGLTAFKNDLNHPEDAALDAQKSDDSQPDDYRATDPEDNSPRGRSTSRTSNSENSATNSPTRSGSARITDPDAIQPKHIRETHGSSNQDLDKAVDNVKQVFGRAASTITKATNAQGCVFFDASPSLFAGASSAQPDRASSADPSIRGYESESSDDEHPQVLDGDDEHLSAETNRPSIKRRLPSKARTDRGRDPAAVLGVSLASTDVDVTQDPLSQNDLKRCLRRYPYGKCFLLSQGEVMVSDQSASDDTVTGGGAGSTNSIARSSQRRSSRPYQGLPDSLLKHLPTTGWLMFLPLFNYAQQQWYACGFIWSNEPDFHNLDTQIPYLKAFGSCIMSEVVSMEAMNTSIARTTFIASISHDLRSPLHGVLGNLEFLEDTLTSAYQVSLVGSIETCGKTLLDTIDHLLDYAKINNLNRATDKQGSKSSSAGTKNIHQSQASVPNSTSPTTIDLALLLEEVTEAAFAGQTFRKKNLRGQDAVDDAVNRIQSLAIDDSKSTEQSVHQGSAKFSGKVFFILDIQHADSWIVSCQSSGAMRRIILNIIGNAIKYCESGCIEAKLCQPKIQDDLTEVTISIKDTGVGMSRNFLEKHLFKAFSQEDSFAAGAGLGLSIARQLVDQMNGKISVRSEKGVGTHVDVTLPMHFEPSKDPDPQDIVNKAMRVTKGKKICLLNPDIEKPAGQDGQVSKLTASIARMSEDWFGLDFVQSPTIDQQSDADIFVYAEPPPIEYLLKHHSDRRAAGKHNKEMALLIVCTNAFEAAALRSAGVTHLVSLGRVIEVISQPVGVRKFAKVLLSSLQRVEASSSTENTSKNEKASAPTQTFVAVESKQGSPDTKWSSTPVVYDPISKKLRPSIESIKWKSEQPQVRTDPRDTESADLEFGQIKAGALPGEVPLLPKVVDEHSGKTRMPTVLAVDDNPINLRLLVTFMKKIKMPYAEAVNGLEAYNKFKEAETPYDFVLMDLQMPVMDGLESTRKIREYEQQIDSQNPATIIAITGVGSEDVKKECMESGMTQFLTKPVKFKTLQQLLERHNNDSSGK